VLEKLPLTYAGRAIIRETLLSVDYLAALNGFRYKIVGMSYDSNVGAVKSFDKIDIVFKSDQSIRARVRSGIKSIPFAG